MLKVNDARRILSLIATNSPKHANHNGEFNNAEFCALLIHNSLQHQLLTQRSTPSSLKGWIIPDRLLDSSMKFKQQTPY